MHAHRSARQAVRIGVRHAPTWSSCAWVIKTASIASWRSCSHAISGRIRSTPGFRPYRERSRPDRQRSAFLRRPVAIHIGIHADFARATEGQVDQSFTAHLSVIFLVVAMDHGQAVHRQIIFESHQTALRFVETGGQPPGRNHAHVAVAFAFMRAHISRTKPT